LFICVSLFDAVQSQCRGLNGETVLVNGFGDFSLSLLIAAPSLGSEAPPAAGSVLSPPPLPPGLDSGCSLPRACGGLLRGFVRRFLGGVEVDQLGFMAPTPGLARTS
jgi:hypothetical protein